MIATVIMSSTSVSPASGVRWAAARRARRGASDESRTSPSVFWLLNTPYIAETRATATKPTTTPMKMMIAGSASDVTFLSL